METIISLKNISKSFGDSEGKLASENINLDIPKGKILGIIGSSGAGKSTLLRCINLLERPTNGDVLVEGQYLTQLSAKELNKARKHIGMIFQHFNLLSSRTVLENVVLPLKLVSVNKEKSKDIATHFLQRVGLGDKQNAYPAQLSGGQKQRVAIARALVLQPSILLCDEATSALDPASTVAILQLLKQINKDFGITIVLITHEMQVVKRICDEVAVLSHGKLVETGTVTQVFENPQSDITKELLLLSDLKIG